jgi:hypothetical protein
MADAGKSKMIYRAVYWVALIAVGLALGLALRKSPPPSVAYDPAAPARVEQKFAAADQAKASGQPAEVQLSSILTCSRIFKWPDRPPARRLPACQLRALP